MALVTACWSFRTDHPPIHRSAKPLTDLPASPCCFAFYASLRSQETTKTSHIVRHFSIQGIAKHQLLLLSWLLCCLCFAQLHAAQEQLETG